MKIIFAYFAGILTVVAIGLLGRVKAEEANDWVAFSFASWHQERGRYNERNPGAGMEIPLIDSRLKMVGGFYVNSLANSPRAPGGGYTNYLGFQVMPLQVRHVHFGFATGIASGYSKDTYWRYGAVPMMSFEGKQYGLNLMYVPPIGKFSGVVGLQFKARIDWAGQ